MEIDIVDSLLYGAEVVLNAIGQGSVIRDYREARKNWSGNRAYFNEISSVYGMKLKEEFKIVSSVQKFDRNAAYSFWCENQGFRDLAPENMNVLVLLALCHEFSRSKSPNTYATIHSYVETFSLSFSSIEESAKRLLSAYNRLFNDRNNYTLKEFLSEANVDFKPLLKEFSDKYSKELAFSFVMGELAQSEELRGTLLELIKEGKLSTYGLSRKTVEKLEKELRAESNYMKTFVVLANRLPEAVDAYLKQQPRIGGRGWASKVPGCKKPHLFSIYVIRPTEGFRSSAELMDKFKSLAKGLLDETMIQIFPIDGPNIVQFNLPADQSFSNERLKYASNLISYFKAGKEYSNADIWSILTRSEIGVNEILALIPFNILVPGILPSEKEFIIKNYPEIQKEMGVAILTDWAEKDSNVLVEVLKKQGEISYTLEEATVKGQKDRLKEIAELIITNSAKLKSSLNMLPNEYLNIPPTSLGV